MKNLTLPLSLVVFTMMILSGNLSGQAPHLMNYQAVVRDANGLLLGNTNANFLISILQGSEAGQPVYTETHSAVTNEFGIATLAIGNGSTSGDFSSIDWSAGPYFLKVYVNGLEMPASRIMSVPYSLYSLQSGNGWSKTGDTLYYDKGNVGIGTSHPSSTLSVEGTTPNDSAIFEVKNNLGVTVFAVYNEGVRVLIDENYTGKGPKGGFAIGGFNRTKGTINDFMMVSPDSIRIYVANPGVKGPKGGFAIGGFDRTKAGSTGNFMQLDRDNYFIGHKSGELNSSGRYNSFLGYEAGRDNTTGSNNSFIGYLSGRSNTIGTANVFIGNKSGQNSLEGYGNVFIGDETGISNLTGNYNTFIGEWTGYNNTTGGSNVFIGPETGYENVAGNLNTFLGGWAGYSNNGSSNVMIGANSGAYNINGNHNVFIGTNSGRNEKGSFKLYIDMTAADSSAALIWGDFSKDDLRMNANVGIGQNPEADKALSVNGDIIANTLITPSDIRFKRSVMPIDNPLNTVMRLNGVTYYWKSGDFPQKSFDNRLHLGLVAQDAEKVIPDLVNTGADGYKAVDYNQLTPLLIEAIKEQQSLIEELRARIEALENKE